MPRHSHKICCRSGVTQTLWRYQKKACREHCEEVVDLAGYRKREESGKNFHLHNKMEKYSETLRRYAGEYVERQNEPEFPVRAALNDISAIEFCSRVQVRCGINNHTILSIRSLVFGQEPCRSRTFCQPERRNKSNANGTCSLNNK